MRLITSWRIIFFFFSSVKLVFLAWLQWQMYNGVEESSAGTCSELIFAPIDASFSDDSPLLPSGFRIIPIDSPLVSKSHTIVSNQIFWIFMFKKKLFWIFFPCKCQDTSSPNCTLDLASTLEAATPRSRISGVNGGGGGCAAAAASSSSKAVMTIAFQFAFDGHLQDSVAAMARQYMRNIISSVQRIAVALSSSRLVPPGAAAAAAQLSPVTPEAATLPRWICQSYRSVASQLLVWYSSYLSRNFHLPSSQDFLKKSSLFFERKKKSSLFITDDAMLIQISFWSWTHQICRCKQQQWIDSESSLASSECHTLLLSQGFFSPLFFLFRYRFYLNFYKHVN